MVKVIGTNQNERRERFCTVEGVTKFSIFIKSEIQFSWAKYLVWLKAPNHIPIQAEIQFSECTCFVLVNPPN